MKVFISGKLYDEEEASISVFDHGLLYGDGVFEGIRIYNKRIFLLNEHIDRLFERFYRVDKSRSRDIGGTGLGLSIVKHIINRHAGSLLIESTEGKGSTFTITLPKFPASS